MKKDTILNIAKSFKYKLNLPSPSSLYGSTDPAALQILHLIYEVCQELRQAACWTQQKKIHTFDTEADRTSYPLPEDFYAPSPFTQWNNDEGVSLVGPLEDYEFTGRLYGGVGSSTNFEYRFFGPDSNPNTTGGQFHVYPTPDSAIECSYEYLSSNLFLPKDWLPSTAYTSGTYVNHAGKIYLCDTNGTSSTTGPVGTAANETDGTTRWDYVSTPYEIILADTDICIFDDDLVGLGLKAKWKYEKGEDGQKAEIEYKRRISKAVGRLKGNRIGSFSRVGQNGVRYGLPNTPWS